MPLGLVAVAVGVSFVGVGAHAARHAGRTARQRRELAPRLPVGLRQMATALNSQWFVVVWGLGLVAGGAAVTLVGVVILVRR